MPTLNHGDNFTVQEYRYATFQFGTDWGYARQYKSPLGEPGTPWAFRHAATLSAVRLPREPLAAHLHIGDVVDVPEYGAYRLARDHNQNVKFVRATTLANHIDHAVVIGPPANGSAVAVVWCDTCDCEVAR